MPSNNNKKIRMLSAAILLSTFNSCIMNKDDLFEMLIQMLCRVFLLFSFPVYPKYLDTLIPYHIVHKFCINYSLLPFCVS